MMGAAVASTFESKECEVFCFETKKLEDAFLDLLIGGGLGAFIGQQLPTEAWESVNVRNLRLSWSAPGRSAFTVAATFDF